MIHRRACAGLLTAALAAGVVAAPTASAEPATAPVLTPSGPTVTLLTGDKVTLGGPYGARVTPGAGRKNLGFRISEDEDGDVNVVPGDALALLSSGRLDPRLFDVSELARTGYADDARKQLPLIVQGAAPRTAGAQVTRELPVLGASAVAVDRSPAYWPSVRDSAAKVWLDGPVEASLDHSVPQIGAPEAWAAGLTGEGATVAVLDTGIDATHPDLSDAVTGAKNFTDSTTEDDNYGHGTHVASIITGSGGKYQGVAPDAKLLNGKVLSDRGSGTESWLIAGMEWAAANGADVINLSLGSSFPSDGTDPMSQAVNRITVDTGTLFVIAAGNYGPGEGSIGSPAAADAALTVGAVDREDQLAEFSSRGPRMDGAIKPDITAPGVDIVAAKAKNSIIGTPVGDGYLSLSGTSMAAPHVAGAAAILAAQHPDWTPDSLKSTLMGTAKPNADLTVFEQGAGRVDVAAATTGTVSVSPASVSLGTAQWPHDDDQPVAKTLTYTNTGGEPVTVDVAFDVIGPDGSPAPQGMFTAEPARLTIPAGGHATTNVTTNTKAGSVDGVFSGAVTGTVGDRAVRTPIAVNREIESYDVKMSFIDHDGKPAESYRARLLDVDKPRTILPHDPSGTVVVRVPKGEYYLEAEVQIVGETPEDSPVIQLVEPAFVVDGPDEVVVDAREGKPFGFRLDQPNARPGLRIIDFARTTAWGHTGTTYHLWGFVDHFIIPSTTSKKDDFVFTSDATMAEWNGTGFDGSPYLYNLRHTVNGTVPEELQWRYRDSDLAKVRSTFAMTDPGQLGRREQMVTMTLPGELTEFYTPDTPWYGSFDLRMPSDQFATEYFHVVEPRTYKLGPTVTERWNMGVFSPTFPKKTSNPADWAGRSADEMAFAFSMTGDQTPSRHGVAPNTGSTTLSRDGSVIGESPYAGYGWFAVPPENGKYTLRANATRPSRLSTQISAEWTFESAHVAGQEPLPLLAVRYAPGLDDHNAAPSGQEFSFPVYVQRNDQRPVRVNAPKLEVSYDDGKTWQSAEVSADSDKWKATVRHPGDAQFVSLRSKVTDSDGSTASQTVIRAYALK